MEFLAEVFHARSEEGLVFVTGDVLADVGPAAFGVAHFAEDAATGARDSFDGVDGAVGIKLRVHRGVALEVGVLRGNLTSGGEFLDLIFGGVEFSFAM